jgi:hypothetical protein
MFNFLIFLVFVPSVYSLSPATFPPAEDLSNYPVSSYTPTQPCFSELELNRLGIFPTKWRPDADSLPPIKIERNLWQGMYISTAIIQTLLEEALNFRTEIIDTDANIRGYERLGRSLIDINPEIWPGINN